MTAQGRDRRPNELPGLVGVGERALFGDLTELVAVQPGAKSAQLKGGKMVLREL